MVVCEMAYHMPYIPAFIIEALCLVTNASYPNLTTTYEIKGTNDYSCGVFFGSRS